MTKLLDLVSDFATGVNKGLTTDLIGAPVDIINMGLKAVGVPTSKYPVGGSDWIKQKLNIHTGETSGAETAGNLSTMFLNPATGIAALGKTIAASKSLGVIATPGIIGSAKRLLSGEQMEAVLKQAKYVDDEIPAVAVAGNRMMYDKTGAYIGLDGQLKSVISDAKAAINPDALQVNSFDAQLMAKSGKAPLVYPKPGVKLPDILDHPELYKAYPELKDITVHKADGLNGGWYNKGTNQMGIGQFKSDGEGLNEMLKTILHETQHGVQGIEGFTAGGSPALFKPADFDKKLKATQDDLLAYGAELKANYPGIVLPNKVTDHFDPYQKITAYYIKPEHFEPLFEYKKALEEGAKLDAINRDAFIKYKNLGGEAESRAVETMKASGDYKGFPLDHYDIPLTDVTPSPLDSIINAISGK
jgi:hypothetical protein